MVNVTTNRQTGSRRWRLADPARRMLFACGATNVMAAFAPWAEVLFGMNSHTTTIYGFWRPEGQLTFMLGFVICGIAFWRQASSQLVPSVVLLTACSASLIYAGRVVIDPDRMARLSYPIHGWEWAEPRWGLTLTVASSIVALCASGFVVVCNASRWLSGWRA